MSLRLATIDGIALPAPARNFWHSGGHILASDGTEIPGADAPLLVQAWARETVKLLAWGSLDTAHRFGLEAERLDAAVKAAADWKRASGPNAAVSQ